VLCAASVFAQTSSDPFDFKNQETLSYSGYTVAASYDQVQQSWTAIISRGRDYIGHFGSGGEKRFVNLALEPLTASAGRQLVIKSYSGGAHCCESMLIADPAPSFRVLFRSTDYNLNFISFDGRDERGAARFCMENEAWDHFPDNHADSPFVLACFHYEPSSAAYVPNRNLSPERLKRIDREIAEVHAPPAASGKWSEAVHRKRILDVTLAWIYAGRSSDGWAFFDSEYHGRDKAGLRKSVEQKLALDPFYQRLMAGPPAR